MTEDMLHELNKNHMNGVDNYGASEDIYNMEDVWNDTSIKKVISSSQINFESLILRLSW